MTRTVSHMMCHTHSKRYALLMSAVNRMEDIAATFEHLAKHAKHDEERRLLEGKLSKVKKCKRCKEPNHL